LGNFSNTTPVTSMLSSLLIQSFRLLGNRRRRQPAGSHSLLGRPESIHQRYVRRLQPLGPFGHLKFHLRAFVERSITIRLDGREVHEHVLTIFSLNETIALGCVKPLHCAFFFHVLPFPLYCSSHSPPARQQKWGRPRTSTPP